MARARSVVATASFLTDLDGEEHFIHAGEVLPATHPVVKARPELFEAEVPVEQATAAPGEKRRR